jgi:hypothetical protein
LIRRELGVEKNNASPNVQFYVVKNQNEDCKESEQQMEDAKAATTAVPLPGE